MDRTANGRNAATFIDGIATEDVIDGDDGRDETTNKWKDRRNGLSVVI